ncbi:aldo/keto reductase [Actinopolyspora halophila]|uniref:aldo/keto reductase n=1 Tax=Actinopolyspora halophila TaxID=1850 RepID=UPI00035D5FE7|nr:aldo/keto reductase [Actinopolyspora halophila]
MNTEPATLPRTGTQPVLGTMNFGDTVDLTGAARMLDTALESGVTDIDTANGYSGGAAEEMLGELLAHRRKRVSLATKVGIPHPDAGEHPPLSAPALRACVRGSLERLGVEHIDVLYLHQPDRATPLDETLSTVSELVTEGRVGALGVSNFAAWQIAEINRITDLIGAPRPRVAQQLHNLLARRVEEEYTEFAAVTGLTTMVYNPLAGGLLTGRHHFSSTPGTGRFGDSRLAGMYTERYWNSELFEAVNRLHEIAEGAGVTMPELALRWLLGRPTTDALLLGASSEKQLTSNLDAVRAGALPTDVAAACDEVGKTLRGPMPAYNR